MLPVFSFLGKLPWPFGGFYATGGVVEKLIRQLHPEGRRFNGAVGMLDRECYGLIERRRADPQLDVSHDLLALFMKEVAKENGDSCRDAKHTRMLRDVCMNFVIAGRDTTACTLTWVFYILATNPGVQRRLCEELDEKLPDGAEATFRNTQPGEMPYLNGLIYESLRLYPPVPADPKVSTCDDILPDGTHMTAGSTVLYYPWIMGRDPATYKDPLKVDPLRWMDPWQKITYSLMLTMSVCNGKDEAGERTHQLLLVPRSRLRGAHDAEL